MVIFAVEFRHLRLKVCADAGEDAMQIAEVFLSLHEANGPEFLDVDCISLGGIAPHAEQLAHFGGNPAIHGEQCSHCAEIAARKLTAGRLVRLGHCAFHVFRSLALRAPGG